MPNEEEDGINGVEGEDDRESVSIFSRTNHFLSAEAVSETTPTSTKMEESSENDQSLPESGNGALAERKDSVESPSAKNSSIMGTNCSENRTEATQKCITDGPVYDREWEDFQTDFETQLESDKETKEVALKSHLEALSELMSSGLLVNCGEISTEHNEISSGGVSEVGHVSKESVGTRESMIFIISDRSVQKPSEGPLSTDILADINMSALDKALDELVSALKQMKSQRRFYSGHHPPPPPPPMTVWEESQDGSPI